MTAAADRSVDHLLGGRVVLHQPRHGYRAAIDPVLLAAAIPAEAGQTVLDVGSGTGAAALCLAARVPECRITGIDFDPEALDHAAESAAASGLAHRCEFRVADIADGWSALKLPAFDHVMTNPPYLPAERGNPSPLPARRNANVEAGVGFSAWVDFCLTALKPKGRISAILRADRVHEAMSALGAKAGEITLFPLWPKADRAAKRVLVSARKGLRSPACVAPGLVLHDAAGRFTPEARAILREGAPISLLGARE